MNLSKYFLRYVLMFVTPVALRVPRTGVTEIPYISTMWPNLYRAPFQDIYHNYRSLYFCILRPIHRCAAETHTQTDRLYTTWASGLISLTGVGGEGEKESQCDQRKIGRRRGDEWRREAEGEKKSENERETVTYDRKRVAGGSDKLSWHITSYYQRHETDGRREGNKSADTP